jgi:hypothetical protein
VKELIAAQRVVEESAERFAFRHALTREAIYAELLARERVTLHREVAAALERHHAQSLDGVVEALAYHAWEAADWSARQSTPRARCARRRAVRPARPWPSRPCVLGVQADGGRTSHRAYLARGSADRDLGEFQQANDDFNAALTRARAASNRRAEWEAVR